MNIEEHLIEFSEPISMRLSPVCGLYMILNTASSKFYVGSAVNMFKRMHHHRSDLRAENHRNAHLQRSFNKHGNDAFVASVIEICRRDQLHAKEDELLRQFAGNSLCLNLIKSASRGPGETFSAETRKQISDGVKRHWRRPGVREAASLRSTGRRQTPGSTARTVEAHVMPFRLLSPDGVIFTGMNRAEFGRRMNLNLGHLNEVINGNRPSHKGWRVAP